MIAALVSAIPRLLADPAYKKIYTANSLQPGYLAHTEYVTFMNDFGRQTEALLKESVVIR